MADSAPELAAALLKWVQAFQTSKKVESWEDIQDGRVLWISPAGPIRRGDVVRADGVLDFSPPFCLVPFWSADASLLDWERCRLGSESPLLWSVSSIGHIQAS